MRFFLLSLILASVSSANAQDISDNVSTKKDAHPVFLNFEEGDDHGRIGDIKVDLFQILLGRFGGGVELYGRNSMRGLYLSGNYYSHFFINILNASGTNVKPETHFFTDSNGSTIPYYDHVTSSRLFRSWNVAIEYRIYKKSIKEKGRLIFWAPYVRFQQTLTDYSSDRTIWSDSGMDSPEFEAYDDENSYSNDGVESSKAIAFGVTFGRRKFINRWLSFEWYFGGGFYVPISGKRKYLNTANIPVSLRSGLIYSIGL